MRSKFRILVENLYSGENEDHALVAHIKSAHASGEELSNAQQHHNPFVRKAVVVSSSPHLTATHMNNAVHDPHPMVSGQTMHVGSHGFHPMMSSEHKNIRKLNRGQLTHLMGSEHEHVAISAVDHAHDAEHLNTAFNHANPRIRHAAALSDHASEHQIHSFLNSPNTPTEHKIDVIRNGPGVTRSLLHHVMSNTPDGKVKMAAANAYKERTAHNVHNPLKPEGASRGLFGYPELASRV